jgi:hypothetical protein
VLYNDIDKLMHNSFLSLISPKDFNTNFSSYDKKYVMFDKMYNDIAINNMNKISENNDDKILENIEFVFKNNKSRSIFFNNEFMSLIKFNNTYVDKKYPYLIKLNKDNIDSMYKYYSIFNDIFIQTGNIQIFVYKLAMLLKYNKYEEYNTLYSTTKTILIKQLKRKATLENIKIFNLYTDYFSFCLAVMIPNKSIIITNHEFNGYFVNVVNQLIKDTFEIFNANQARTYFMFDINSYFQMSTVKHFVIINTEEISNYKYTKICYNEISDSIFKIFKDTNVNNLIHDHPENILSFYKYIFHYDKKLLKNPKLNCFSLGILYLSFFTRKLTSNTLSAGIFDNHLITDVIYKYSRSTYNMNVANESLSVSYVINENKYLLVSIINSINKNYTRSITVIKRLVDLISKSNLSFIAEGKFEMSKFLIFMYFTYSILSDLHEYKIKTRNHRAMINKYIKTVKKIIFDVIKVNIKKKTEIYNILQIFSFEIYMHKYGNVDLASDNTYSMMKLNSTVLNYIRNQKYNKSKIKIKNGLLKYTTSTNLINEHINKFDISVDNIIQIMPTLNLLDNIPSNDSYKMERYKTLEKYVDYIDYKVINSISKFFKNKKVARNASTVFVEYTRKHFKDYIILMVYDYKKYFDIFYKISNTRFHFLNLLTTNYNNITYYNMFTTVNKFELIKLIDKNDIKSIYKVLVTMIKYTLYDTRMNYNNSYHTWICSVLNFTIHKMYAQEAYYKACKDEIINGKFVKRKIENGHITLLKAICKCLNPKIKNIQTRDAYSSTNLDLMINISRWSIDTFKFMTTSKNKYVKFLLNHMYESSNSKKYLENLNSNTNIPTELKINFYKKFVHEINKINKTKLLEEMVDNNGNS